jgi:hypothetical protein
MHYRLRTLLIVLAIGPPLLAGIVLVLLMIGFIPGGILMLDFLWGWTRWYAIPIWVSIFVPMIVVAGLSAAGLIKAR